MNPSTSPPTESQKFSTNDPAVVSFVEESPESPTLIRRRKIFGTCKGCNQPNTNFNECQTCINWLNEQGSNILTLKSLVIRRKSLIYNQSCLNCNQPKHIHHKIAACNNCGFPEYDVVDLCELPMTSWLRCPDYNDVIDMICLELDEMNFDDPDYQKLSDAKEHYENLLQLEEDEWEADERDDDETDEDEKDDHKYNGIIDPKTVLSILGLQRYQQHHHLPSSLRAQTNSISFPDFRYELHNFLTRDDLPTKLNADKAING
ncbi:12132_t:CDS:2 [Funneliformis geosporum]|uniref:12132_t:CDS:1 n=1 Tax=Funneliformis geosporum TaxID=1117311 RepID=A0A9W4SL75_9GLOM|nr:12132_t:CDS:2 [Funneliformis geosporum]